MENDFQENLKKEYDKFEKSVKKPNIFLIGGTGVGKSSLINLVFGKNIAPIGVGKPVTQEVKKYEQKEIPVVIFDAKGYEVEDKYSQENYINNIIDFVSASKNKKPEDQIHLVWYLIQSSGHRVTEWDQYIIKKIKDLNIPISVVFTKCDLISESEGKHLINEIKTVETFQITTSTKLKPLHLELNNLLKWSFNNLQPGLREAFSKAQKVSLEIKSLNAKQVIVQHTTGNAIVGFTPIPFADAPILLTSQAAMVARILYIYDLQSYGELMPTLLKSVSIGTLISTSGKWLVGQFLKLIPAVGTAIGGLITGAVAASITFAVGTTISEICFNISRFAINGEESKLSDYINNLSSVFKELIKKNSKTNIS